MQGIELWLTFNVELCISFTWEGSTLKIHQHPSHMS